MKSPLFTKALRTLWLPAALSAGVLSTGCSGIPIAARAPALAARDGCGLWVGELRGNDRARMELEVCPLAGEGSRIVGRIQFTSPRSGWSTREVEGSFSDDGTLHMREVAFGVYEPELFWIFCLADEYELSQGKPGRASGSYESKACHDHGVVTLRRATAGDEAEPRLSRASAD